MSAKSNIDQIRRASLDRVDRSERQYKIAFFSAAAVESMFLLGFILLADFSNRTHTLILIAAVAIYGILALGLVALGSHVSRCTNRILLAMEVSMREE